VKFIDVKIEQYALSMSSLPGPVCQEIEDYTKANVEMPQMIAGPLENSLLGFFIRLIDARIVVELGTYTGYSALAMAEQLPSDGQIFTFDVNPETTTIAKKFWEKSPHGKKIHSSLLAALDGLKNFNPKIDIAFVDANKLEYLNYVQTLIPLLSSKGMIVVDNTLWSGKVLEATQDAETQTIHKLNKWCRDNPDLYTTLLPIRDGILLIQKLKP
jgi:caffeoyl-CoA O-methyltransferase